MATCAWCDWNTNYTPYVNSYIDKNLNYLKILAYLSSFKLSLFTLMVSNSKWSSQWLKQKCIHTFSTAHFPYLSLKACAQGNTWTVSVSLVTIWAIKMKCHRWSSTFAGKACVNWWPFPHIQYGLLQCVTLIRPQLWWRCAQLAGYTWEQQIGRDEQKGEREREQEKWWEGWGRDWKQRVVHLTPIQGLVYAHLRS